ncbi:MAG: type V CRISPR-associated endonuclease Cas1 [Lachnospiraceae bacterium]|nr:type V CRISPR-associated endonuclease Cas1 [Lachnospiraceae bacterium]
MLEVADFSKKQIIVYMPPKGDKISYRNDNIIISDSDGKIKYQITCYRIFALIVVGDCSVTTGIIRRARKFGFSICFMTYSFRLYSVIGAGLEGNFYLHEKQYSYTGTEIASFLMINKIKNQRETLNMIRRKNPYIKEGIGMLDGYLETLIGGCNLDRNTILGIEGSASKVYFARMFAELGWKGRKPRVKPDYINSLLDIGYTVLFEFIDCLLNVFGFDVYKGVYHTCFYMRKSLVCDIMEPFRPIVDWRIKKGIALQQFKKEDFFELNGQWQLEYKKSSEYISVFMNDILENKDYVFRYVRDYYRSFMKGKDPLHYKMFLLAKRELEPLEEENNDRC